MPADYAPASAQGAPTQALVALVEHAVGETAVAWRRPDTGLSPAQRFSVTFAGGKTIFVKAAATPETAAMLRIERLALEIVPEAYVPRMLAWVEDGDLPVLLVEDLSSAHWPAGRDGVDWRPGDIDRVLEAIRALRAVTAADDLPKAARAAPLIWPRLLADREAFLRLELCSADWLIQAADVLAAAERGLDHSGSALVHGDMRSDNLCLTTDRVVFVDWSHAHAGSPDHDLALFLPSAHLEGAPPPEELWRDGGPWAAWQAAQLSVRAVAELDAPRWLRQVFRRLAKINLDWAAASLGLPPPSA